MFSPSEELLGGIGTGPFALVGWSSLLRASELTCDWGIPFTSHLFALTCLILLVLLTQNNANL